MTSPEASAASGSGVGPASPEIHVICRANRGRSPVAAHLLRAQAHRRGISVPILDSGLYVAAGHRPVARLVPLVAPLGIDLAAHRPTATTLDRPERIGLVVTFETSLKYAVVGLAPTLNGRVFTLRELVRLSSSPAWRGVPTDGGADLATLVSALHRMRPLVDPGDDDTPDPAGLRSRRATRRFLRQLAADTERVSDLLWAASPSASASPESVSSPTAGP